jgi:RHS repeat-associated protein
LKLLHARERGTPRTVDNKHTTDYRYDANGERIIKKSELGETQYVSANYIVRNKTVISKHVFAGNQRIASTVSMKNNCGTMTEQNTMYFHPDHLGSSSYVTDKKGNFFEMIEYLPYGETLYDEAATVDKTEFRFTSKEQDAETGFYYYGARYYDAKLCKWISADPILEMYLQGKPAGGIYNSVNMNLYAYCANNSVRFVDTDGNHFEFYANIDDCFQGGDRNNLDRRVLVSTYIDGNGKVFVKQDSSGSNLLGWSNTAGTSYRNEDGTPLASVLVRQEDKLFLMEIMSTDTIAPDGREPNRIMHYNLKPVNEDTGEVDTNSKNWKINQTAEFTDSRKGNASVSRSAKLKIITGYKASGNKEGRSDADTAGFVKDWKYEPNGNFTGNEFPNKNYRIQQDTNDKGKYYDKKKEVPK